MVNIQMNSGAAYNKQTISNINNQKIGTAKNSTTIKSLNRASHAHINQNVRTSNNISASNPVINTPQNSYTQIPTMTIPRFVNQTTKGQKITLDSNVSSSKLSVKFGWNVTNNQCDVDVSAFLLNSTGKVIGDNWFVFYGQDTSPDRSTIFSNDSSGQDREMISIDFTKLNPQVSKIVFVLTINEALSKNLNFSMLKDAYVRILNSSNNELVSFLMSDYYSNVTSMMIGEIYQHNGNWKFNAIGNGVAKDLAGLCKLYGVEVI